MVSAKGVNSMIKPLHKFVLIKKEEKENKTASGIVLSTEKKEVPSIASVIAPGVDYHWYVQNSDGYWSHKPGTTSCTKVDASGNFITDPQTANRNYSYANYSKFCGYYIMTRN